MDGFEILLTMARDLEKVLKQLGIVHSLDKYSVVHELESIHEDLATTEESNTSNNEES